MFQLTLQHFIDRQQHATNILRVRDFAQSQLERLQSVRARIFRDLSAQTYWLQLVLDIMADTVSNYEVLEVCNDCLRKRDRQAIEFAGHAVTYFQRLEERVDGLFRMLDDEVRIERGLAAMEVRTRQAI